MCLVAWPLNESETGVDPLLIESSLLLLCKFLLKVYQAVVLPSLLYACETWTTYSRHIKQLNAFHMRCLRSLLHIKWQDKVPDTEVLQRAQMEGIHAILLRHQLRWAGHVHRMDDCRLPKRLFYGELLTGKRTTGRPKKRYKDTLKGALKLCTIPQATWHEIAVDRTAWRSRVRSGVDDFEERRIKKHCLNFFLSGV